MKRIILLFFVLFACHLFAYSQISIVIDSVTYFDNLNQRYDLTTITINNEDTNSIILWIADSIGNKNVNEDYYQYFFKSNEDFSLNSLMTEQISTEIFPTVGTTFYKKLSPHNTFSIIFLGQHLKPTTLDTFINRQLHYISNSNVPIIDDVNGIEYPINQIIIKVL